MSRVLQDVSRILLSLEERGLVDVRVASGFVRGIITGSAPSDIDIQYFGGVSQEDAQRILREEVESEGLTHLDWDYEGIWNVSVYPKIECTSDYHLRFFINSIDSVSLTSSGKFDDPTGYGIQDAKPGILRLNDFTQIDYPYKPSDKVYLCLRGIERIVKHGWTPTEETISLITAHSGEWDKLSSKEKSFYIDNYIKPKFSDKQLLQAMSMYKKMGWEKVCIELKWD